MSMDLFATLKTLRRIQPDPRYCARSRRAILRAAPPRTRATAIWRWFATNVESGASLALAGLCIFIIFAGFSIWKSFSPLGIAKLDLAALRAEAEAIDIQIQLAGLRYQESTLPIVVKDVSPTHAPLSATPRTNAFPTSTSETGAEALPASASSTSPLTIDEALLELSK